MIRTVIFFLKVSLRSQQQNRAIIKFQSQRSRKSWTDVSLNKVKAFKGNFFVSDLSGRPKKSFQRNFPSFQFIILNELHSGGRRKILDKNNLL